MKIGWLQAETETETETETDYEQNTLGLIPPQLVQPPRNTKLLEGSDAVFQVILILFNTIELITVVMAFVNDFPFTELFVQVDYQSLWYNSSYLLLHWKLKSLIQVFIVLVLTLFYKDFIVWFMKVCLAKI